jgi:hypothetical protein
VACRRGDVVKIDRGFLVVGMPFAPPLVLVGYAVLLKSGTTITDPMLCALLVFPTAAMLVLAAVAVVLRRGVIRWLSMAIGVTVGTVGVAVVGGGISAIAWMISGPGSVPQMAVAVTASTH